MDESSEYQKPVSRFSRRTFLKGAGIVATMVAGGSTLARLSCVERPNESTEKSTINLDGRAIQVEFGQPEKPNISGINWFPDGHTSFLKDELGVKVFMSGGPSGYLLEGSDLKKFGRPYEILSPVSTETFDRNYAAPGCVILGKNPNELLMFYHGEYHPKAPLPFPFNAGIGLAISSDNGKIWEKKGQILKGMDDQPATDRVYGAGQPSAIIKGEYIYLYYIDWNGKFPDSIHLARSPLDSNGVPNSWEKFVDGKFVDNGMTGNSTPVITAPEGDYAALPGVSWNTYLNKFLAVFESKEGFNVSTSFDGISWGDKQRLLNVQTINNNPKTGQIWNSYPTLWSPSKLNDRETDNNLLLVYSEGKYSQEAHSMRIRPIKLSAL